MDRQRHNDASACGESPASRPVSLTLERLEKIFSKPCTQVAWAIGRICAKIESSASCIRPELAAQRSPWSCELKWT